MIRLLLKGWSYQQKIVLRNSLVEAYKSTKDSIPIIGNTEVSRDYQQVSKDIANALSWLEDDIDSMR